MGLEVGMFLGLSLEQWARVATILGGFAAFITLPIIWWQLKSNSKQSKRERSYEFASRYYDPNIMPHIVKTRRFLTDTPENNQLELFKTDDDLRVSVGVCLSLFEEIGAMYNMNLLDKEVIRRLFKPPCVAYYNWALPFIGQMRKDAKVENALSKVDSQTIFAEWQKMYEDLIKK